MLPLVSLRWAYKQMIVILLAKDILLAKERHLTQSCTSEEGLLTQLSDTSFTLGSDSHALAVGPRAGHFRSGHGSWRPP